MKRSTLVPVILIATAIVALLVWLTPGESDSERVVTPAAITTSDEPSPVPPPVLETPVAPPRFAGVDGKLEADSTGHLRLTPDVRWLFDYFLLQKPKDKQAAAQEELSAYLNERLSEHPTALADAKRLMESYVAYLEGLNSIPRPQLPDWSKLDRQAIDAFLHQVEAEQALRNRLFSPQEVAILFSNEESNARNSAALATAMQSKAGSTATP